MKRSHLFYLTLLIIIVVALFGNNDANINLGEKLDQFSIAHASLGGAELIYGQQECHDGTQNTILWQENDFLQDYEKELYSFILRREYDTDLNWCVDKRVRDTGPFVQGTSYGIHPAVRIYYSPRVMYWLTGDPAYWEEGNVKRKKPREGNVPEGGMIIKEMFTPPAALYAELEALMQQPNYSEQKREALYEELLTDIISGWAVMVKAGSGSKDGWFWAGVNPAKENQSIADAVIAQLDNYEHIQTSGFGQSVCLRCHASADRDFTFIAENNIEGFSENKNLLGFFRDNSWRDSSYLNKYPLNKVFMGETAIDDAMAKQLLWLPPQLRPWVDTDDVEWGNSIDRHSPSKVKTKNKKLPGINRAFATTFPQVRNPANVKEFPSQWADHVVPGPNRASQYITSDNCLGCHGGLGGDPPDVTMFVQTGPEYGTGYNVSEYGEWRWSPMGLAGRDPIFYAQLESEMTILKHNEKEGGLLQGSLKDNQEQVTSTCLSCHGAMGQRQLKIDAREDPDLNPLFRVDYVYLTEQLSANDKAADNSKYAKYGELAREGISCTVCHHINPPNPEKVLKWKPKKGWLPRTDNPTQRELAYMLFYNTTGQYEPGPADELNGPFKDVREMPMEDVLGITPTYNEYIKDSKLCGSCHTINLPNIGQPFDKNNILNDSEQNPAFKGYNHTIEQATFLEWQNSAFGEFAKEGEFQSCQECHMPGGFQNLDGTIDIPQITTKIATIQDNSYPEVENEASREEIEVPHRTDYRRHEHVGLNVFLLEMFNQFPDVLGVAEKDEMTYATTGNALAIENMVRQARNSTIDLDFEVASFQKNNLKVEVAVKNKTGHRFPSGVSFRRAFVEFLVMEGDKVIWGSGRTNSVGVIVDEKGQPLKTEFLDVKSPDGVLFQPHHEEINNQNQVQIYEELNQNSSKEFTTSFIHRDHSIKDNRLLPKGWKPSSYFKSQGEVIRQFMAATDPHGVGSDSDYEGVDSPDVFAGQDKLLYNIQLPRGVDRSKLSIKVTMYYQSIPPYYLNQRFTLAPNGEATQRLYYLTSRLNLEKTPMKDWKLPLVSEHRKYNEVKRRWE
jgi:mono/diheme cytochrome c family protein